MGNKAEQIWYLKKDVKRRLNKHIAWNSVILDTQLFQKDSIRTLSDSVADIKFSDGSILSVEENSLIVIERPEVATGSVDTKIFLEEGSFRQTLKTDNKRKSVIAVTTNKLTALLTSEEGKIGIRKKDNKLKIAILSGKTQIRTLIEKPKFKDEKTKLDSREELKRVEKIAQKIIADKNIEKKVSDIKEEVVEDLLEIAVYSGGEANLSLDEGEKQAFKESESDLKLNNVSESKTAKIILLKPNEVIRINSQNVPTTGLPIKNDSAVNILKEEFVPTKIELQRAKPVSLEEVQSPEESRMKEIIEPATIKASEKKENKKAIIKNKPKGKIITTFKKKTQNPGNPQIEKIRWKARKGIKVYFIDISKDEFFTTIIKTTKQEGNEIAIDISPLIPGVYYWRKAPVKGKDLFEYEKTEKFIVE